MVFCVGMNLANVAAQTKQDSLWKVWSSDTQADSSRLKAIQALTWPMLSVDLDSAYQLANMQLKFAQEHKDQKWIGKALYNIATYYYYVGDYPNSLDYYHRSLCLLYTSPSPRDGLLSRMPSSA